jgi:hypothetical protein
MGLHGTIRTHTVLSIDDALRFIAHEDILWVMT